MTADESMTFQDNAALNNNSQVSLFKCCVVNKYQDIVEDLSGVEAFANYIR